MPIEVAIDVRDRAFAPVPDATVEATLTSPGGETAPLALRRVVGTAGRFVAALTPERAGPVPRPRRGAARPRRARQPPTAGSTSAAAIGSSPIRG